MKQPDPSRLLTTARITFPLIGLYDAPEPKLFSPIVEAETNKHICVFAYFQEWLKGITLHITAENYGCGGSGYWLCSQVTRSREAFLSFLVDTEGLKASRELMGEWIDAIQPYRIEHGHLLLGPLHPELYQYLKSITFYVNPDQLGLLMLGAQYHAAPGDPTPVIAPFGSGCSMLAPLFDDYDVPQALVGAMDIAMRQYLPPDILAFTTTRPMFERLCSLDEKSFLYKPFWRNLLKARGQV
ncbi:DUF169 domain-containing protein [bacterium]|nr:DUF169 domain-containing protein [candidate division CSSED10-310 bacterium]